MKKLLLVMTLFVFQKMSYGQCNKLIVFTCDKVKELRDGSFNREEATEASVTIEAGKITLTATINGETGTRTGEIEDIPICEWTDFLKNGRAQYKVLMKGEDVISENTLVDIQSENGYTTITFGSDPDTGSKIQFEVREYTIAAGESKNDSSNQQVQKKKRRRKVKPVFN